jgi:hypothetical protein
MLQLQTADSSRAHNKLFSPGTCLKSRHQLLLQTATHNAFLGSSGDDSDGSLFSSTLDSFEDVKFPSGFEWTGCVLYSPVMHIKKHKM